MQGWIKLHRIMMLESTTWMNSTPEQKVVLITLLLMANHTDKSWEWQGKPYKCVAGQFVTSIESIRKNAGISISTRQVRTSIKRFVNLEFLTIETTSRNSLITICKWETYQSSDDESDKVIDKPVTNDRQTDDKPVTTNKNVKKDKNANNDKKTDLSYGIFHYWNTKAALGKVRLLTDKRKLQLKKRLTETEFADNWMEIIDKISSSDFCTGLVNGWKATFDWMIHNQGNYTKVLEGNYDNRQADQSGNLTFAEKEEAAKNKLAKDRQERILKQHADRFGSS